MSARWLRCAAFLTTGCVADSTATLQRSPSNVDRDGDALVATVLGRSITESDLETKSLDAIIIDALFARYREDNGIAASEAEIDSCRRALFDQESGAPSGADSSSEPEEEFLEELAQAYVINWKTSKQMYHDYGGTVIFQPTNPLEPIGAYQAFLKEQEKSGALQIHDAERASSFWARFTNVGPMVVDPARVDYSRPWWEAR